VTLLDARNRDRRRRQVRRSITIGEALRRHGLVGDAIDLGLAGRLRLPRRRRGGAGESAAAHDRPVRLRVALEEIGAGAVKLGQVLSTRPDLVPPEYISELGKLQDTVAPVSFDAISTLVEQQLGPLDAVFTEFEQEPIAAASLGQVHGAMLRDGRRVVVKVQRPGIADTLGVDLDIITDLAGVAHRRDVLDGIVDFPAIADEFAAAIRGELDYRREGRNADRLRAVFASDPTIQIPWIAWEATRERVLVMERIDGIKVDDIVALDASGHDRHRIAQIAAGAIMRQVFDEGFFHADPHPGNIRVLDHDAVALLDFGRVGFLDATAREQLARLMIACVRNDPHRVVEELSAMGVDTGRGDRARLERDLSEILHQVSGTALGDISMGDLIAQIMRLATRHALRMPTDLALLGHTLTVMEGVGRTLDPGFDAFAVAAPYATRLERHQMLPSLGGIAQGSADWLRLMESLPRHAERILRDTTSGGTHITMRVPDLSDAIDRLDRIANRLIASVVVSAVVVAIALVMPTLNFNWPWRLSTWLAVAGFVTVAAIGIWLAVRVHTSDRRR
jgi:ubiquinone biosynthesis protein